MHMHVCTVTAVQLTLVGTADAGMGCGTASLDGWAKHSVCLSGPWVAAVPATWPPAGTAASKSSV